MTPFERGKSDCAQDSMENAPFASIGGLGARLRMKAPRYIDPMDREEYLKGYRERAEALYGLDWETCKFSWQPALVIGKQ